MIIHETYIDEDGRIRDNLCRTYSSNGVYISPKNNLDVKYEEAIDPKKFIKFFNAQNVQQVYQREYVETDIKIEEKKEEVV